ncbi:MAG TPA: S4 domain-containing protein, partial [Myxococcota bacterium]|nr:S4 domain-containing protein [Myxococcota bacterium]
MIRLNKFIADAGLASRRHAEQMILEGRVTVNGRTATIGESVDPERDRIMIDGTGI